MITRPDCNNLASAILSRDTIQLMALSKSDSLIAAGYPLFVVHSWAYDIDVIDRMSRINSAFFIFGFLYAGCWSLKSRPVKDGFY